MVKTLKILRISIITIGLQFYLSVVYGDCTLRETKFLSYPSFTMENQYIRVTVVPYLSGRITEYIYKPTGYNYFQRYQEQRRVSFSQNVELVSHNFGGYSDQIWEEALRYNRGRYRFEILKSNSEITSIKVWKEAEDYKLERIMSIYKGSTELNIKVKITHNSEAPHPYSYWAHSTVNCGGDFNFKDDVVIIPLRKNNKIFKSSLPTVRPNEERLFVEHLSKGGLYYFPKQSWWAVIDREKKFGVGQIVLPDESVDKDVIFHTWCGFMWSKPEPTVPCLSQEVIFPTQILNKGENIKISLSYFTIPGIKRVNYLNKYIALAIEPFQKDIQLTKGRKTSFRVQIVPTMVLENLKLLLFLTNKKKTYKITELELSTLIPGKIEEKLIELKGNDWFSGVYQIKGILSIKGNKVDEFTLTGVKVNIKEE